MRKALLFILLSVFAVSFSGCLLGGALSEISKGSLKGQVIDSIGGDPVSDASVTVESKSDIIKLSQDGSFKLSELATSCVAFTITRPGFVDYVETMKLKGLSSTTKVFSLEPKIKLDVQSPMNGTITKKLISATDNQLKVELSANPNENYVFDHWEIAGGYTGQPTDRTLSLTVSAPTSVKAVFVNKIAAFTNSSENYNTFGFNADTFVEVCTRFPYNTFSGYVSGKLTKVNVYTKLPDIRTMTLNIYSGGSTETGPDILLASQNITARNGWNEIVLNTPICLPNSDLWIGYSLYNYYGERPIGYDKGPGSVGQDYWRFSQNGQWYDIKLNWDKYDYNLNITGVVNFQGSKSLKELILQH